MTATAAPPANGSAVENRQAAAIDRWLRVFHPLPGPVVELRALNVGTKKAVCEVFGDLGQLARRAVELDGAGASGCYFTPNPLRPEIAGWKDSRLKASDVTARRWLLIDCDSDKSRPAHTNATDAERDAGWRVLDRCKGLLDAAGLGAAVVGDSGNGWHLCYPIDLPNDDDSYALVKAVIAGLGNRCNEEAAAVASVTFDAPRIWKLYGTRARKGPAAPERPHRWARLINPAVPWAAATAAANSAVLRGLPAAWQRQKDLRRGRPEDDAGVPVAERARRYVEKMAPAIAGQHGHDATYAVAQVLARGFGLGRGDSWPILLQYNGRCAPPWSEGELLHKIDSAEKNSQLPLGYLLGAAPPVNGYVGVNSKHSSQAPARLAPETEPPATEEAVATAADLIRLNATIRWAWEGWIPVGVLTILASDPGRGKTRFCADLARRLYLGLPWPDGKGAMFPAGSTTLWVAADNQHAELGTLPTAFGFPPESLYLNAPASNPFAGTMLDDPDDLRGFEARIKKVRPALVFVDTCLNATDRSSHKPEDAKAFFTPLQRIAQRQQIALVMVTHLNAGGKPLGRRIMGQGRVVVQLDFPNPGQEARRRLAVVKSNSLYPAPLGITMGSHGNEYDTSPPEAVEGPGNTSGAAKVPEGFQRMCDWLEDALGTGPKRVSNTRSDAEAAGFSSKTLYAAMRKLQVEEYMMEGKKWWRLAPIKTPFDELPP